MRANAQALRKSTERAIYATFGGNLLDIGEFSFRIDNFLCELAANPKRVHVYLEKLTEFHLDNLRRYLGAVEEYVDIIGFGDDLAMQTDPQIWRAMCRQFFKARHRLLWQ